MKKSLLLIILALLLLSGCGSTPEVTEETSEETVTEEVADQELTDADYILNYIEDNSSEAYDNIIELSAGEINGKFTVICSIHDVGKMAVVADYVTIAVSEYAGNYENYDVMIEYFDESGWVCTWHSYDNKTGILINTLSNATSENVTVDELYKWNNGEID